MDRESSLRWTVKYVLKDDLTCIDIIHSPAYQGMHAKSVPRFVTFVLPVSAFGKSTICTSLDYIRSTPRLVFKS